MTNQKCNVKDCIYEFRRYGKYDVHEHDSGMKHELQQWFCGAGHENWETRAW